MTKVYWNTLSSRMLQTAVGAGALASVDDFPDALTDEEITTVVDGRDHLGIKIAALQAHRSQLEIRDALRRFPRRGIRRWGSRRGGSLRAAVVITVVTGGSSPAVLLTQRVAALRECSGQYVLPGGRIDPRESAPDAGRRALAEGVGMRLPPESVLGLLDDYETRAGSVITPVVAWAGKYSALLHSSHEAPREAQVFAVPFTDLDVEPVFVASSEPDRPVIRLPLHGEWLHAPTAAVLYQFREVVLRGRPTRVTHLMEPTPIPHSADSAGLFGRNNPAESAECG